MNTPVAFLIFNRPSTTEKVFETIARAQPPKLLVVADGPRRSHAGDDHNCALTRAVIDRVDWDCEVLTNYSDENLGCRRRVASGLTWVFEKVEEAIILEDDCRPDLSFFRFCEELLEKYRDDTRVMMISGDNFQFGRRRSAFSYYFSRYIHIWGWASWRRAWRNYDAEMKAWPTLRETDWLSLTLKNEPEVDYWREIFDLVYSNRIDTWDYQWTFACWLQKAFCVIPATNLVSNIGFGDAATHTGANNTVKRLANLPANTLRFPLKHPFEVSRDVAADEFTFHNAIAPHLNRNVFRRLQGKLATLRARVS